MSFYQVTKNHYEVTVALSEHVDDGDPDFVIGVDAHNEDLALAHVKQNDDFHFEPGHYTIRVFDENDKCVATQTFESFGRFHAHKYERHQSDFTKAMQRDMAASGEADQHNVPRAMDAGVTR